MQVTLSRSADRDLRAIRSHIAADNPIAAGDVAGRIIKALLLIRANPGIGRPINSVGQREWSVPGLPYVIPYLFRTDHIYVVRIHHARRKLPVEW